MTSGPPRRFVRLSCVFLIETTILTLILALTHSLPTVLSQRGERHRLPIVASVSELQSAATGSLTFQFGKEWVSSQLSSIRNLRIR